MHSYLRAIGFSEYKTDKDIDKLFAELFDNATKKRPPAGYDEGMVEAAYMVGDGIGIVRSGEVLDGKEVYRYYYPFCEAKNEELREGFFAEKRVANEAFTGVVDDIRAGVSIIFHLMNVLKYKNMVINGEIEGSKVSMGLSALSISGNIILPIKMSTDERRKNDRRMHERAKLVAAAKEGDERAMESLAYQNLDEYSKASRRIGTEDLYTVVSASLMPYGLECDLYSIVAQIREVKTTKNIITGEKIWLLSLDYNDIIIDMAINDFDLVGEPEVGRRFKGVIWLQGDLKRDWTEC